MQCMLHDLQQSGGGAKMWPPGFQERRHICDVSEEHGRVSTPKAETQAQGPGLLRALGVVLGTPASHFAARAGGRWPVLGAAPMLLGPLGLGVVEVRGF